LKQLQDFSSIFQTPESNETTKNGVTNNDAVS